MVRHSLGGLDPERELSNVLFVAHRAARRAGANSHEAEEVAQITAFKLWKIWHTTHLQQAMSRDRRRWDGYISATAKNVHYDLVRGHQRRLNRQEKAAVQNAIGLDRSAPAPSPTTAADIEACVARALIGEEIKKLPIRQRQIAVLVWMVGLTPREAAETLGIQAQTVRKTLNAARERLREGLVDPDEPD